MDTKTIVVLEGDETGQELLDEALRVLAADTIGFELEFPRYDLSLESRRKTGNEIVHEAARAIVAAGLGLKAATVTPETTGDVGSPNRILREEIGAQVIVRTGRRIPGITPVGGVHAPISVVRMAVGDAYGAREWREGSGRPRSPTARSASIVACAARLPSFPSVMPCGRARRSSAGRSTPSAPSTKEC